jgi:hypothetical protein
VITSAATHHPTLKKNIKPLIINSIKNPEAANSFLLAQISDH